MKDKTFKIIVCVLIVVGMLSSGLLVKYTLDLLSSASLTAIIATENF